MRHAATGRIAWITTDLVALEDPDRDLGPVTGALAVFGFAIEPIRWRCSADVDWSRFDAAVIRSPWDYPEHLDAFLEWLNRIDSEVTVLNDPELIRWNLDKAYLLELEAAGIPIVPTALADSDGDVADAMDSLAAKGEAMVVVKPNISAGSRDTGLFQSGDPAGVALAKQILANGKRVLIQPGISDVATDGERGMIFFDGVFSHAIRKGPILQAGGGLLGGVYTEQITVVSAEPEEVALARQVVAACPGPVPLYARVDLVSTDGRPLLLEAELFEPSLFCDLVPGAARHFAQAIARRTAPLG